MHNPLRSESDAFRLVLFIGGGAAAVVTLALITRPAYGRALAGGLLGLGAGFALRGREPAQRSAALWSQGDH